MFSNALLSAVVAVALALQASAHAGVNPALGVKGNLIRADVQRPSTAKPCGNANIASTLDTSTAVTLSASGSFSATGVDFNAGADGSRSFSAKVDASGTGKTFVAAKVTKNGNANPSSTGSDALTVQLPAGTKCTGGKSKNLCLVSFTSTAGFGNCLVVKQGGAKAASAAAAPAKAPAAAAAPAKETPAKATTAAKATETKAAAAAKSTSSSASSKPSAESSSKADDKKKGDKKKHHKHHKGGKKSDADKKKAEAKIAADKKAKAKAGAANAQSASKDKKMTVVRARME